MSVPRALALAVASQLIFSAAASAQTVIVRNAPPASTVSLMVNTGVAASATADAGGMATLAAPAGTVAGTIDANVWVDTCGDDRRVVIARVGVQPPLDAACRRAAITGIFVVQAITTMVIDVSGTPTLRLRQGRVPEEWLRTPSQLAAGPPPRLAQPGIVLFGGGGLGRSDEFTDEACGNVGSCARDEGSLLLGGGVAWWFTDFLAAEGRYVWLGELAVGGSGDTYRFDSTREGGLLAAGARAGVPLGRVRPYGVASVNYHRATSSTTQTVNDTTITVDGAPQIVPGGTQTFQVRTGGWGWGFAGGLEIWFSRAVGMYAEGGRTLLKGTDVDGGEGRIDDAVLNALVGIAVRLP